MKINKIAITLLLFVLSLFAFSQSIYVNTPTAKDYPDSDAIVLKEKITFELDSDGRISEKVFRVEKVFTYQGLDHIGDPLVSFDKETQTFEAKRLRTYTKEAKVIDAKQNSFTEMTPFELEKSPDYTNIRQMVLTKVGMDLDSVVETEYEIKDVKPLKRNLEKALLLSEDIPILEKEIEVIIPSSKELHIKLFNSNANVIKKEEAGKKIYSVVLKNLPRLYHSEFHNGEEFFTPFLVFTTASNWSEQSIWLKEEIAKSAQDKPQALIEKVSKLTEKNVSLYDKVKTLHDFVVTKYRTVEWNLEDFGYAPRKLSRIFETRYGNSLDKAVLLGGMVETLGLKPEYYLFSNKPVVEIAGEVPALSIFDKAVLSVNIEGKTLFFNPEASLEEFSSRNVYGKKALKIGENAPTLIAQPNVKSQIVFKAVLESSENLKMKGSSTILVSGNYVNYEGVLKKGFEAEVSSFVSSIINNAEEIKVRAIEFTNEKIEATAEFVVDIKKGTESKKIFANLITGVPEISLANEFAGKSERALPKILPFNGDESYEITFKVPENAKLFNVPRNLVNSQEMKIYQKATTKENEVTVSYGCSIPKKQVSPKEYEEASKSVSNLLADSCRTILFEEIKKK